MPPHPESAAAAVTTLRAELDVTLGAIESTDRKAALVPAVLGVIAGIFIAPDGTFTGAQAVLLLVALATGFGSVLLALRAMRAKHANIGPDAGTTVAGTRYEPADFHRAVAGSLAMAVDQQSELTRWKGRRLNWSMDLAAVTILLLALARIAGGLE